MINREKQRCQLGLRLSDQGQRGGIITASYLLCRRLSHSKKTVFVNVKLLLLLKFNNARREGSTGTKISRTESSGVSWFSLKVQQIYAWKVLFTYDGDDVKGEPLFGVTREDKVLTGYLSAPRWTLADLCSAPHTTRHILRKPPKPRPLCTRWMMSSLTGTKWTLACIFIRGLKIESGNSSGDGVEQETTKPSLPSLLSAEPSRCTQLFNAFCWNVNRTRPKILTRCVIVAFKGKHCICGETVSHAVCWQWRVMLTSWRTLWFTHRPDNLTTPPPPPPITGDVSPKVTDIKSDLLPSTWGWYSWQLHRDETKGNKSRAVPLQCLRGFWGWEPPTQRGRGGEGERGGGASPHSGARSTSQIGRNWGEAAWPWRLRRPYITPNTIHKINYVHVACFAETDEDFLHERWLEIFSDLSRLCVSAHI